MKVDTQYHTLQTKTVSSSFFPTDGSLEVLSRDEVRCLRDASETGLHTLMRRCVLAVLASGSQGDDPRHVMDQYKDFDIQVLQQHRGIKIELTNAPAEAFVDRKIVHGVNELLMAVVRDIVYVATQLERDNVQSSSSSPQLTRVVFYILRNARILLPHVAPCLVVCWGGHSISRNEYDYSKDVGYQLGLRMLDVCTGCGPGAMKGPMKGATIAHTKQRRRHNRYVGITEPGIIASESPNPIVSHLVIMPDIEKRLEAFVRIGHGFVVFPGGVGTCEEILYLVGILLQPENAGIPFPLILTGPSESAEYFEHIDRFLRLAFGSGVAQYYRIIIDDPIAVSRAIVRGIEKVHTYRLNTKDAFYFNWGLKIPYVFQQPFNPTHEAMANLRIHHDRPRVELAADLRRVFSGIVAGNVKEAGMRAIEKRGPFDIDGDPEIMHALDTLLESFVDQERMRLPGDASYVPCYRVRATGLNDQFCLTHS